MIEQEMIKQNLELTRENNRLLKKLVRKEKWNSIMRVLHWVFLITLALATYYYLQPYIQNLMEIYGFFGDGIDNLRSFTLPSE